MDPFAITAQDPPSPWLIVATHLLIAFAAGFVVSFIYQRTRPKSEISLSFPPTLVLLAILIAMVTQVVGNQTARAFSLVGVLSIVRFRTVVRDTRDTAFVIFTVVVGMACGAGYYHIVALGLLIGGFAAALVRPRREVGWSGADNILNIRVGLGADPKTLLTPAFAKHLDHTEVVTVSTVRQGAALDYTYHIRTKPAFDPAQFVRELNQIEGVQNVELRRGEPDQP
jgi:uncharacterized membrane protein YhiD involved in acid resistance